MKQVLKPFFAELLKYSLEMDQTPTGPSNDRNFDSGVNYGAGMKYQSHVDVVQT